MAYLYIASPPADGDIFRWIKLNFDFFDDWNKTLRWILFIPMLPIAYTITFFVGKYCFWFAYGWIGLSEESILGFIILHFYLSFACFVIPIQVSVACAPKGKIIIASIYLGVIILLLGFATFSLITYGDGRPIWQSIYDYTLNLIGAIVALITVISQEASSRQNSFQV